MDGARVAGVLREAVDSGAIPGAVAIVADSSGVLFREAVGLADVRDGSPMQTDHVFRIASMTKLATTFVALQLVAEGRLDLDAEVARYVPEFASLPVLDGFDESGAPVLRPAASAATVRSLLTHTSGLGYDTWNVELDRYLTAGDRPRLGSGLREGLLGMPLVADPGIEFNYGTSMDWLGLVLEQITGQGIDVLYRNRLFVPLDMADTAVWTRGNPAVLSRLAAVHVPGSDGWLGTDADYWSPEVAQPEFFPAGHCLYATADDYMRLQRVALGVGAVDGVRILPEELNAELFVNHIGDLDVGVIETAIEPASADVDLRGWKWSLGLLLAAEERPGMRSAGSAGWEGGFNTFYWMDPARDITAALHTATLPFHDPGVLDTYEAFERAVYAG